jgi:hypothetical protein
LGDAVKLEGMMDEKEQLIAWLKTFARKVRGEPDRFTIDEISSDFYLLLDCTTVEEPDEYPETVGKCDIYVVPLNHRDWEAEKLRVVENANKHGIMRFFAALGIDRFPKKVKCAFYETTSILRA